jgi:hypothetical protein
MVKPDTDGYVIVQVVMEPKVIGAIEFSVCVLQVRQHGRIHCTDFFTLNLQCVIIIKMCDINMYVQHHIFSEVVGRKTYHLSVTLCALVPKCYDAASVRACTFEFEVVHRQGFQE